MIDHEIPPEGVQRTEQQEQVGQAIAYLFLALSGVLVVLFLLSVFTNSDINEVTSTNQAILAFLDNYGLIIPTVIFGGAIYCIRLFRGLRKFDVMAAAWAELVMFWAAIGGLVVLVINLFNYFIARFGDNPAAVGAELNFLLIIGCILTGAIGGVGWYWMQQNRDHVYEGQITIGNRDSLLAWNLLVPTVVILIVVAARPLERTFIGSLTDREFGGGAQEVNFVGAANYAELLMIRFDQVPCERLDDGSCEVDEDDGTFDYVSVRDHLESQALAGLGEDPTDEEEEAALEGSAYERYRELRFREVRTFGFGESAWIMSARDDDFMVAVGNTLFFTFVSVTIELILGMIIALTVNSSFPGRGAMRAAMLIPWAIPTVVSARLWEVLLRDNTSGPINALINFFGGSSVAWLGNPDTQIWSMIFVDVWKTTPFMALLLLAGLQTIPSDIYEAADVDGAGPIRKFFNMTLPLLRPTIAVALVFRTLDAIRAFDVFDVLVGRQLQSMATYNQFILVNEQEFGYASAVGVTIFVIILIFTIIYVRALGVDTE